MKKVLCILFAMIAAFSCFSMIASAEQADHCKCDYCGAKFVTAAELSAHLDALNPVKGHAVECAYCTQSFTARKALAEHERMCKNDAGRTIACKYKDNGCGEKFHEKADYAAHIKDCEYESVWTLLKAGKIIDALKVVDWKGIYEKIKPVVEWIADKIGGLF